MRDYNRSGPARPFGCYGPEEIPFIRSRVAGDPLLKEEYDRQKALSIQFAAREQAAPLPRLGSYRTEPWVFLTPSEAASMTFSIRIEGDGEVRIAHAALTRSQRGLPVPLQNGAFAEGLEGWSVERAGGRAELVLYEGDGPPPPPSGATPPPDAGGTAGNPGGAPPAGRVLRIRGGGPAGDARVDYMRRVPVYGGEHYSLQTALRLDAPLAGGVGFEAVFYSADGRQIGTAASSPLFNRPTPTGWAYLLEAAAADANLYLIEDDAEAAARAKRKLVYMLADMRQGMDIFRATGWHDDDIYGAVHIGRGLAVTSVLYDQIADSGCMTGEEQAEILGHFRYIAAMMMDTAYYRFDLETFPDEKGGMRSNWNADRATGLGVYALLFPDEEQSEAYLAHARSVIDWQLEEVVDASGAWPENIRYHGAVLHRYFLFFALLKRLQGTDYFQRGTIKGMYRFLIGTATAADAYAGGGDGPRLMSPPVGDANVNEQWFRLLGYAAPYYTEHDPELAAEMMWCWRKGGRTVRDTGAFPYPLAALLYPAPGLPERMPDLKSAYYPEVGYVIFRSGFGRPGEEDYALFEASPLTYHAHQDEGHFSIWSRSVPLTLDSGTGGYYNGDRHWYESGSAHNVVQFLDESGQPAAGPLNSVCEEVRFTEELDYVRSRIPDPAGGEYFRHFAYVKAGYGAYIVWDHISSLSPSVWNLHTLSTDATLFEGGVIADCLGGMKLTACFAEPSGAGITADTGAVGGAYPLPVQQHFRVRGQPGNDYLAVLYPQRKEASPVRVERLAAYALPQVRVYAVQPPDLPPFLIAVNGSRQPQTVLLGAYGKLRLLEEGSSGSSPDKENEENRESGTSLLLYSGGSQMLLIQPGQLCVLVPAE